MRDATTTRHLSCERRRTMQAMRSGRLAWARWMRRTRSLFSAPVIEQAVAERSLLPCREDWSERSKALALKVGKGRRRSQLLLLRVRGRTMTKLEASGCCVDAAVERERLGLKPAVTTFHLSFVQVRTRSRTLL